MMAKKKMVVPTEKMLMEILMDLCWADNDAQALVEEVADQLKALKKTKRKTARLRAKAEEQYESLYGPLSKDFRRKFNF